jgi:galactose oxidase
MLALLATIRCGGPAGPAAEERVRDRVGGNWEIEIDPVNPNRIELFYVCGNEFNIRNANRMTVLVHWKVQNSADAGMVVLPAPPPGKTKSETHFTTKAVGTVYLYYGNTNIRRYANLHRPCASPPPPPSPQPPPPPPPPTPIASGLGQWSPLLNLPVTGIHNTVLPDGRLILWSRVEDATVWNWRDNSFKAVPAPSSVFCGSQTFLTDGRLLNIGGHITDDRGLRDVNVFNPATDSWTRDIPMRAGRWYPTLVNLPGGELLALAGAMEDGRPNAIPEVRRVDGSWRQLTGAVQNLPYYSYAFLGPDGRVFVAGPNAYSRFLDTSGTGKWTSGPRTLSGLVRSQGAALTYEPGKLAIIGGGLTPTSTVETFDLNVPGATFQAAPSMNYARRQINTTVLPDGRVLVTGGTSAPGFNNASGAVLTPELWDPAKGTWTTVAPMKTVKLYHSTAVLLPDARVLSAGGVPSDRSAEIYSPPYLFNSDGTAAVRPSITVAPQRIAYNQSFDVETPDADRIASVALIGLPATTHGMNFNQRFLRLPFTTGAGRVTVTAPAKATLAPPSFYYLFILDGKGVPSEARVLVLQ